MPRAEYDPRTFRVSGCRTAYEISHEFAHLKQHYRSTLLWRARELFTTRAWARWTGLGGLVNLAVEAEAALIARKEMKACGIWLAADAIEARRGLFAYASEMGKKWS